MNKLCIIFWVIVLLSYQFLYLFLAYMHVIDIYIHKHIYVMFKLYIYIYEPQKCSFFNHFCRSSDVSRIMIRRTKGRSSSYQYVVLRKVVVPICTLSILRHWESFILVQILKFGITNQYSLYVVLIFGILINY